MLYIPSSQTRSFKLAVQERYNQSLFHVALSRSLQGVAERPLPCNYNVIFHGGNTGSNPVGDAKSFQELTGERTLLAQAQKGTLNLAKSVSRNRGRAKQANDPTLSSSFVNCDRLSVCV